MSTMKPDVSIFASSGLARQDWIAGLEKGLGLLESFNGDTARMSASQAAQVSGLSRTAARRYLLTLAHLGFVATDGKLFWLTPRVLRLGQSYLESARLPQIVQPYLQRITAGTNEVAYLSVLDNQDVVYVARNGPHRGLNMGYVLGARVQAQVTAAGLLMLAMKGESFSESWLAQRELKNYTSFTITSKDELSRVMRQIRHQGWTLSEQQLELGFRGIAVPLRDRKGEMIGALSVTMPIGQESGQDALLRVLPVLRDTAHALRNLV